MVPAVAYQVGAEESDVAVARGHKHWTLGWRCILHIAQSACKWGLAPVMTEDLQHSAHIVVKSLINSSDPLYRRVDEFLHHRVFYDHDGFDVESARVFWSILGITDDRIMGLLLLVNPRWDERMECLKVSGSLQGDPEGYGKIRSVVMFCLQWQNWSDTRWTKFQTCAKLFLRSKAVGIDFLANMVATTDGSGNDKHYIHGFHRYTSVVVQKFFLIASVATEGLMRVM